MKNESIKKWMAVLLSGALLASAWGCSVISSSGGSTATATTGASATVTAAPAATVVATELPEADWSSEAVAGALQSADCLIELTGAGAEISGEGAAVSGSDVVITQSGTYLISGVLTDGSLIVNAEGEEKVKLLFNGVDITCSYGPAVLVEESPKKCVIELCTGSVNKLTDGAGYETEELDGACILSRDDLTLKGFGTLYVTGTEGKGIFSKDDLVIEEVTLYVKAADDGLRGKDSVTVSSGEISVEAGGDGIKSTNTEDSEKGFVLVEGGTVQITAQGDGIFAAVALTVSGGEISLTTGGGYTNAETKATEYNNSRGGKNQGGWGGSSSTGSTSADSISAKGLKSDGTVSILGGYITADSADDTVHAVTVTVSGGELVLSSGDDGVHADDTLLISGGNIEILTSYEGLEAFTITLSGGTIRLTASDDGVNAAGGSDDSQSGGFWGRDNFSSDSGASVELSGAFLLINAQGDGLDSNGSITMTAGTVLVFGPTGSGNGALDFNGSFALTGGCLLAVGSTGMAQIPSVQGQGLVSFTLNGSAGELVSLMLEDGTELCSFEAPKSFGCVIFTGPALTSGKTCLVYTGGFHSGTLSDYIYAGGSYTAGTKQGSVTIQ